MNIADNKRYLLFQVSWFILITGTVCDLNIADNLLIGSAGLNIQLSSLAVMVYLFSFILIFPFKKIKLLSNKKFDRINIYFLLSLLLIAFISSYLSLFQKYAVINTTSRYLMYFFTLVITIYYIRVFENAEGFIIKSFVYVNFFIATSSIAEYFIPAFYKILISDFGVMESKNAIMRIGNTAYMRPSGFITDSNLTAFTLAYSSFLLLLNRLKFNRIFEYAFYLTAGLSLGLIASRSAVILILFLLAVMLIIKRIQWKHALIYFVLLIAVQVFAPQTQARFFNFSNRQKINEEIELGRVLVWKGAYVAMTEKPLIGIGSGVFFRQSDIFISKAKNEINEEQYKKMLNDLNHINPDCINPHNIFLTMQIEHGITGLILFIALILFNLIWFTRSKNYIALASTLGILFVSSLSNYAPYYKYYLLMIIVYYVSINCNLKPVDGIQRS